ncbi:MAG: GtrA family protein [Candidatus Enterenecus sp.]
MKKKLIDASVWKFLLVGVANTLLSALLMFLLEGLGYWPSTAIAYAAGAVLSFFLNRSFTFRSDAAFWPSVLKFAVNAAVCYLIAYSVAQPLVSLILSRTAISAVWQERAAKVCGMGLYTCINYFGQRFFAFRKK